MFSDHIVFKIAIDLAETRLMCAADRRLRLFMTSLH
jgi:hypothetical protein